jgi:ATP-binding cassette, subfamily C, bacterial CydD
MAFERRLLPASGSGRRALTAAVMFGMAAGGLVVAQAFLLADLVANRAGTGLTVSALASRLALLAGLAVLRAVATWASETAAARAAVDVRLTLRGSLTSKLLDLGPHFSSREHAGELAHTLGAGVESTDAYVAQYLPQLALSLGLPLLVVSAVLRADLLSGLVLAATWPLIPLFMYLIGGVARARTRAQWVSLSRMSARFLDAIQGAATLVTLGRADDEAAVIGATSERFRAVTMGVLRIAFVSALTLEWLATLGTAVVAVQLGLRLLYGRLGFDAALAVLIMTPEFYRPLRALGAAFHGAMSGREAAGRIGQLLETPSWVARPAEVSRPEPAAAGARDAGAAPARDEVLCVDHVSFRYSPDRPPALDDVSLRIERGATVALLGPSGSGKSTVASLALRFIEPDRGRLLSGGRDLQLVDPDEWRRCVAWLPQRPHLFHGTVLDNLRLARPDATDSDIERAVALAHADEFIRLLPHGLLTEVGEEGARLSGGQAQRLALARAFLKDSPFVVLDEPTSQLDPESDALVSDAVTALSRGRTVLLIAHRLMSARDASLIVVLSGGRVAELGTHAGLLARGGVYSRIVAASTVTP